MAKEDIKNNIGAGGAGGAGAIGGGPGMPPNNGALGVTSNGQGPVAGEIKTNGTGDTPNKSKKVEIDQATLEKLVNTVEALQENNKVLVDSIKKRDEDIEMLKSISDKGRLSRYLTDNAKNGVVIRTAKIGFWEQLPIIAWKKGKDEVGFRDGRLQVSQTINLFLDEGKKEPKMVEVEYLRWAQNTSCELGEVVEKTVTNNGEYWTVQMKDGRKVTLDIRFINPF